MKFIDDVAFIIIIIIVEGRGKQSTHA